MNPIYVFEDWTSVIRMKNIYNPNLTIKVDIIRDLNNESNGIDGYHLTILDKNTSKVYYAFYINYSKESVWSITESEAISILNTIGFLCELKQTSEELSENVIKILTILKESGYTHIGIVQEFSELFIRAFRMVNNVVSRELDLETTFYDLYDYNDYSFIKDFTPVNIEGLLKNKN